MQFIIEFYKELEALDLIIFWGIIIVIVLLLIFALILLNKNKKLKKIMDKNNKATENNEFEELPIKNEKSIKSNIEEPKLESKENEIQENIENTDLNSIVLPEIPTKEKDNQEKIINTIETEKKFIAEEHVIAYNTDLFSLSNIKKANEPQEEKTINDKKNKPSLEMPTGPYQRNVLREMSLSQTSPIGITIPKQNEDKKIEIARDLEESLNEESKTNLLKKESTQEINKKEQTTRYQENINNPEENKIIKKELTEIKKYSPRKTEIENDNISPNRFIHEEKIKENMQTTKSNYADQNIKNDENKKIMSVKKEEESLERINKLHEIAKMEQEKYQEKRSYQPEETISSKTNSKSMDKITEDNIDPRVKELFNSVSTPTEKIPHKSSSEKYLEEVSRKLAEAEIQDEIERTDYELEQEENAIISYKELMEKKDSIQTIDEEEAIISIEELMNRNNQKEELANQEDTKLYNLTEEEENDDFIKELKQFRNDL